MDTVPFTLSNVFAGFGEGEGLLHNEGTHLCVEYQVKDGIVGMLKSEIKQLRIPIDDLVSVTLTKGWFGTRWPGAKLIIQADRMDAFEDMPSASQGRLELSISRKDFEVAEDFVYALHKNEKVAGERPRA
jgi:hypothetical protein